MQLHVHVNAIALTYTAALGDAGIVKDHPNGTVVRTWTRLVRAQQLALAAIERRLKAAGLPPLGWYDALLELERAGQQGLRPFELERAMLLAQYNLSRLLERLARAGYIERRPCADDKRGQVLVITPAGRAMRRRMWAVYGPAMQAAIGDHLGDAELEKLSVLLGTLIEGEGRLSLPAPGRSP
jgi:DNA-binding MarR family transcriptional regulator